MKNLLTVLALSAALAVTAPNVNAGLWDVVSGMTKETVKSTAYTVEASGANLRVYEWETKTDKICTAVISDDKGIALDCDRKLK